MNKYLMHSGLLFILLISTFDSYSKFTSWEIRFSNNTTGVPFVTYDQLFYSNFHPGLDVGLNYKLNSNVKHQLLLNSDIGVFYHRYLQTALKVYPELEYKFVASPKWEFFGGINAGYMYSFENVAVLKLDDNGDYNKISSFNGRNQFMGGLKFGAGFKPSDKESGVTYIVAFSSLVQGPFVKGYVPIVPYNSISIGVNFPIIIKNVKNEINE